jgi:hypothetical protein
MSSSAARPHSCDIRIDFPTAQHTEQTLRIMQVDEEIGDRVTKSFSIDSQASNQLVV